MSLRVHWASLGESTFVAGIWFLHGVHRLFGRWPFRLCLYPVLLVHWLGNRTARQASLQYLRRLEATHGAFGTRPGWRHGLRHFRQFAETLLDKLLAMGGHYRLERVRMEGQAAILDAIAAGRGGVLVTAHVGCLELCEVLAEQVPDFRLSALVHTRHAERFNRLVRRLNPRGRVRLLQVTEVTPATAMELSQRVAAGEFVAIAGDRVPPGGGRSQPSRFLGHDAPWPIGPYVLAAVLKCPVFLMACVHEGDGYRVRFARLADRIELPRRQRAEAIAPHLAAFVAWLEAQLRQAPYDWFNFFPFWDQAADETRLS